MSNDKVQTTSWSSQFRRPPFWKLRLRLVIWWRRIFWPQWDESQTPHRVFTTVCRNCGDRCVNIVPVPHMPRLTWECGKCLKMAAFEVRE